MLNVISPHQHNNISTLYSYNSLILCDFATSYKPNSAVLAMKAFLFIIVSLLASVSTMAQKTKFDIEADLQRLDSVVANSANYDRQKQQNINLIKRSAGTYVTPTERYNFYKRMYRVHEVRQRFSKALRIVVPEGDKPG